MIKRIRYLYEYQDGRRVQNVGFVKLEEREDSASIQMYGKDFPTSGNQPLELFLFYLEEGTPIGIKMGEINGSQPMFGYRLLYTVEDLPSEDIFRRIEGLILQGNVNGEPKWYAALWNDIPVAVENMVRYEERLSQNPEPETEPAPELEPEPEPETEQEYSQESELGQESKAGMEQEKDIIYKIAREDLVRLPRNEWKLANHQFLIHGYYNYHHLVSFEKDGKCWLGVPGTYHPKEQRAAGAFGFGQFMKPDEGEIELGPDEKNEDDDFGYWCREVSKVIRGSEE